MRHDLLGEPHHHLDGGSEWTVPDDDVVALSLAWEAETGCDSIPTIERVYDRAPSGAYLCPWPDCKARWHYSGSMWRHVHSAHGCNDLPPSETTAKNQEGSR